MTPKQSDFLRSLAAEKDITSLSEAQQAYVARVLDGSADPTPAQASRVIDALLALPRKAFTVTSEVDVPAGRFAVVNEAGVTEFFVIDRPTEGRWAGRTFVSQQASDEKFPVRNPSRREEVLARIAVDPQAAMIRYGHELGRCGNCGRTLTDEVSRAMGIGPDCAKALGMIRPSVEEVVAPAATPPAPAQEPLGTAGNRKPTLGWRERKAAVKEQQGETSRERTSSSQLQHLPGESWEDIFA